MFLLRVKTQLRKKVMIFWKTTNVLFSWPQHWGSSYSSPIFEQLALAKHFFPKNPPKKNYDTVQHLGTLPLIFSTPSSPSPKVQNLGLRGLLSGPGPPRFFDSWDPKGTEKSKGPFQSGSFDATGTIKIRISVLY